MIQTGLERLLAEEHPQLKRARIGLIMNHTSVDRSLRLSVELLLKQGYNIAKIFAPEHGFRGDVSAGEQVEHTIDHRTGLPVYSLYGSQKRPSAEMLEGLDALIFDLQDIGVRFYTYIYTMAYTMEEAAKYGIEYYVLDRPNPINGVQVEGNIVDPAFDSFVGQYGLPIRHGMTIGELAQYFNQEYSFGCQLHILPMTGWKRECWYDHTSLPWVMPSPNATGLEMAALYPGTCLIEGTNVSEGRGTTKPFEMIGAPWIDGEEWREQLEAYPLEGLLLRAVYFTPLASKYTGEQCQGLQFHVVDRDQLKPVQLGLAIIQSLKDLYPEKFTWLDPFKGRYFIDLILGTNAFREHIEQGKDVQRWMNEQETTTLQNFKRKREQYLLY